MSIINQTLRELDARQPAPAAPTPAPAAPRRHRPGLWALAVVLLPIAGAAGWIAWSTLGTTVPQPTPIVRPAQPASAPAAAAPVVSPPAAPSLASVSTPPPVAEVPVPAPATDLLTPVPRRTEAAAGGLLALRPSRTLPVAPPGTPVQPVIQHQAHQPSSTEIADAYYRKALAHLQAGRADGARLALLSTLDAAPAHVNARLALAALLSRSGQATEAEALLRDGHATVSDHPGLALSLARLQAARGDNASAAATLLDTVGARGVDAEYRAILAALLVQLDRPGEAASHYEHALRQRPDQGTWWAGLAMCFEAQGKMAEARNAYQRALQTGNLPENLTAFARGKLGN